MVQNRGVFHSALCSLILLESTAQILSHSLREVYNRALLPVQHDIAITRVDRRECLSYKTRPEKRVTAYRSTASNEEHV